MVKKQKIIVFGSGHISIRLKILLEEKGYEVSHIHHSILEGKKESESAFSDVQILLDDVDFSDSKMIYIVDDSDNHNLEFLLAVISKEKNIPITVSLFNENVSPHLRAAYSNITVLNPAKIAAEDFVRAVHVLVKHDLRYVPPRLENTIHIRSFDKLLIKLTVGFILMIIGSAIFFHFENHLSWLDSFYFVVVTICTVGYGDINLLSSSDLSKVVGIFLMLGSMIFIWVTFSLIIDQLLKQRVEMSLGRRKYRLKDHIILCGLGRVGYFIADKLVSQGEKVIIVENNNNSPYIDYFRHRGGYFFVADARIPKVLQDAGVLKAKAVISVISDDAKNLEIGLNARSFNPDIRLVLRIFDNKIAEEIKEHLDIHLTLSMSEIAVQEFLKKIE